MSGRFGVYDPDAEWSRTSLDSYFEQQRQRKFLREMHNPPEDLLQPWKPPAEEEPPATERKGPQSEGDEAKTGTDGD